MTRAELELDLLREVHEQTRAVMRYHGIDRERAWIAFDKLREAMYAVNDFDQEIDFKDSVYDTDGS